jgi:hypothetical protein
MRATIGATAFAAAILALTLGGLAKASMNAGVTRYPNCKALNRHYPHGVGRWGAHDHTSGTPVTNFKRSNILYRQNKARDADHDGIACEKK